MPLALVDLTLHLLPVEQWGKLTDDDLDVIAGEQDQLEGRLQERYGYAKDQAEREIDDWYGRQTW